MEIRNIIYCSMNIKNGTEIKNKMFKGLSHYGIKWEMRKINALISIKK